jgi:hypothetical protein
LAKPPVIIVNQEFRLFLEADVPDLLFGPLERWMIGYMQGYDLSTGKLHDDEYIKDLKGDRVLHKKSQDQMALAWFFKKLLQVWESVGPERLLIMYLRMVELACRRPNLISNSKAIRSSPYSG